MPDRALLEGLDLIIFDMQDVGSRYYTYVNTLALTMEAVSGMGIELMVLDAPTPSEENLWRGRCLTPGSIHSSACSPYPSATA